MEQVGLLQSENATAHGDRDCWATPQSVVTAAEAQLGVKFSLDVCAMADNTKAARFYNPEQNGLRQSWRTGDEGWWWCNPPFSDIEPWVAKATREAEAGNCGVCILPANRTGKGWFHNFVIPFAEIRFLRGRVAFIPPPGVRASSPSFSCLLAVYDGRQPW